MRKRLSPAVVLTLTLMIAAAPAAQTEAWRGAIDLSEYGQGELEFFVTFTVADDGSVSATLSIPAQGAHDMPVTDVVYDASRIEFTLVTSPNNAEFSATREADVASGVLNQGVEMPITLRRMAPDESAAPKRPQTPEPPFPYSEREVSYTNPASDNALAGTLTVPEGPGPHPAVLLITGSGSQDRDETIFGHKPFWVLADHLSRNGIAVLRVDDRGIGGSDRGPDGPTSLDYADDVLAGVAFLQSQGDIDSGRIGLMGHSEGGLIAPIVAARSEDIAFIVMLAGTGISGAELMPLQLAAIQRVVGLPEDNIERQLAAQAKVHELVIADADKNAIREAVGRLVDVQIETAPAEARAEADLEQAIDVAVGQMTSGWYRTFLMTDPREWLAQVRCPVLALNGTLDLQVPADANLPEIERVLREAGNPDVTVRSLDRLNHLFQTATTGSVGEYGQIEETFAPEALEIITTWVRARTGLH